LTPDDVRAEPRLRTLLDATGWRLVSFADEDDGYLALAERLPR
ncbi:SAM-dependent methyltransferase, partial [Streptomyces nanshensis]